ncbi:alpha/beta fold hydrolase [Rhizobium sp. WYJ-E13]|uniref:alpha/beta fold hydrolase n=1 Tax=Rhizobium sp. WYJ-E13 TaxID=2849093 RepID=UPI001C1ED2EF|nr:alpha/beta hydrolase [Rhizobium sp. WYJ-E13]QWW72574.1 alpha/beta hydrolase [Rhizobium sp. WYJ-E13]
MYASINGTEIFFDIEGGGLREIDGRLYEHPTIFVLHGGLGFDHGYLRDGLSRLSDIAQIVYVDLRGQGRSGRPPLATSTLEAMADDVAELIRYLGVRKPYLFGHSAGGFVAMLLALRNPGLIGGLILSGTSPTVAPVRDESGEPAPSLADRASPDALAAAAKVFSGEITMDTVATFFDKVGPYYAGPDHPELTARLMRPTTQNVDMMRHFMTKLAPTYDLMERLSEIAPPVLVLVGAYDWVCPPRAGRAIANGVQHGKLVEFQHSGHFVFSEEPSKFRSEIEDFFASSTAPGWY